MPKVSIIVPIYKVEKYLNDCINDIYSQTYKDFEVILVDDGSPDNCPKMCDEFKSKYDNITVIHKENGGLSSARNAGLDVAKGDYVFFFDPDDRIDKDLLEKCIKRLEEDASDAVRFGCLICNGSIDSNAIYKRTFENSIENCLSGQEKFDFIIKKLFKITGWEACFCLYSLKVIRKYNLRFADNRKIYAEDLYFACLFTLYANKISLLNGDLYKYVRREDSIMGQTAKIIKLNEMNLLSKTLYSYIKDTKEDYLIKNYFIIHYLIIFEQTRKLPRLTKLKHAKEYDKAIDSIKDKEFFDSQIKIMCKHKKQVIREKGFFEGWYQNMVDKYLLSKNKFTLFLNAVLWRLLSLPYRILQKIKRTLKKSK